MPGVNDSVPLGPIIEPGDYRATWQVPARGGGFVQLEGELQLAADRPPNATAFGEVPGTHAQLPDGSFQAGFPQVYPAGDARGRLLNGREVVLIGVQSIVWPGQVELSTGAALIGRSAPEQTSQVRAVRIQIENLDAVAAVPPLARIRYPNWPSGQTEPHWEAWPRDDSKVTWRDSDAKVELDWRGATSPPNGHFFRVQFSPVLTVEFEQVRPFDEVFRDWVEPLRRIVSLATGRAERTTYLEIDLDGAEPSTFQTYGTAIHQEPYASGPNTGRTLSLAFRFGSEERSPLTMLRLWQQYEREQHPLLETFGSLMYARDQHPRARFLLLIQALEGLYGYDTAAGYDEQVERHMQARAKVIEAAAVLDPKSRRFLNRYLMKRPPSSLDQALAKTIGSVPVNIADELAELPLLAEYDNVYAGLRTVRNELAHGRRGREPQDLQQAVVLLDGVVRAHLLAALGCAVDDQKRAQGQERR